jgi:hypothetical protein
LGGYGLTAGGEISKTFRQLPAHAEIRLKANFHFIDAWSGETAFAKLENQVSIILFPKTNNAIYIGYGIEAVRGDFFFMLKNNMFLLTGCLDRCA